MKITISGAIGSGKSTVAKLLAKKLGYKYFSIGTLMREMAIDRGISLSELTELALKDPKIDHELDRKQKLLAREDNFVMDSRLGFHFIPQSTKIFLEASIEEAANRIVNEKRSDEKYKDLREAISLIKRRMKSESIRYKKYYNIQFTDKKNFDLIIDTTTLVPEKAVNEIIKRIKIGQYQP
jgi:CMP/dCMP kinase